MALSPESGEPSTQRYGQEFIRELGVVLPYIIDEIPFKNDTLTKDRQSGQEGAANTELTPLDTNQQQRKRYTMDAIGAAILGTSRVLHTSIDYLRLPDTLLSVTPIFSKSFGDGDDATPAAQQVVTSSDPLTDILRVNFNPSAQSQGSGAVTVDVNIEIQENSAENVPASVAFFFVAQNETRANILTAAKAVFVAAGAMSSGDALNEWPKWRPKAHSLVLHSENINIRVNAETKSQLAPIGDGVVTNTQIWGSGKSFNIELTNRAVRIGPTIHGTINITPNSDTQDVEATVDASTPVANSGAAAPYELGAVANTRTETKTATGTITPTTLAATNITAIPTTGHYCFIRPGESLFGYTSYSVTKVDFSYFA